MIQVLEVAVSLIFFTNKTLVLIGKRSGWLIGSIAAALACWYFLLLNLYVYVAMEAGIILLMGYGFIKKEKTKTTAEWIIRLTILISMLVITIFAFQGQLTIFEFISSLSFMFGTYWLTHKKEIWGWLLFLAAHIISCHIGYSKNQNMFADFQIASAIVCLTGVIKTSKSRM